MMCSLEAALDMRSKRIVTPDRTLSVDEVALGLRGSVSAGREAARISVPNLSSNRIAVDNWWAGKYVILLCRFVSSNVNSCNELQHLHPSQMCRTRHHRYCHKEVCLL
jgi:hypothetical protein